MAEFSLAGPGIVMPQQEIILCTHFKISSMGNLHILGAFGLHTVSDSDADPDVFGPPRSGSFYHQAKIIARKTLIPTVL
jgi:hypothetical protein